jgi:hypothetical protein
MPPLSIVEVFIMGNLQISTFAEDVPVTGRMPPAEKANTPAGGIQGANGGIACLRLAQISLGDADPLRLALTNETNVRRQEIFPVIGQSSQSMGQSHPAPTQSAIRPDGRAQTSAVFVRAEL